MVIKLNEKRVILNGYAAALAAIKEAKPKEKICVYLRLHLRLESGKLEARPESAPIPAGAEKVGTYGRPISRCRLSWDIRTAAGKIEQRAKEEAERLAFEKFIAADAGIFDGFLFPSLFHREFDKRKNLWSGESDDAGDVSTPFGVFHVGADGVTVYAMTEQPKKQVRFNRSVYLV